MELLHEVGRLQGSKLFSDLERIPRVSAYNEGRPPLERVSVLEEPGSSLPLMYFNLMCISIMWIRNNSKHFHRRAGENWPNTRLRMCVCPPRTSNKTRPH